MLQCVTVCCSVLQYVAVRYSMLQCVAVCCSALQYVAVRCIMLWCLQYVAVQCSMLQCVAVFCSVWVFRNNSVHLHAVRSHFLHVQCLYRSRTTVTRFLTFKKKGKERNQRDQKTETPDKKRKTKQFTDRERRWPILLLRRVWHLFGILSRMLTPNAPAPVGALKWQVSFAEYGLFYRALLYKRPII